MILCQPGVVKVMLALPSLSVVTVSALPRRTVSNPFPEVDTGETSAPS